MVEVFGLALSKVTVLLIFIAIGYFMRLFFDLHDNVGQVLLLLCAQIFAPAYSIANLSKSVTMDVIGPKLPLVGYGLVFVFAAIALSFFLSKPFGRNRIERNSLIYAFSIPNYGYFGYPVIEGVFGQTVLVDVMIFLIPLSLFTSSFCYVLLVGDKKVPIKKAVLNPMVVSLVLGLLIGLSGIQLPTLLDNTLGVAGSCMSPCSMLLAGFILGKYPLKDLLTGWRPYVYSGIRLIGIPLIFGVLLRLLGVQGQYLVLPLLVTGLPLGLNLVVYPNSQGHEMQAKDNAKLCLVSYLLAIVTLPVTLAILAKISA